MTSRVLVPVPDRRKAGAEEPPAVNSGAPQKPDGAAPDLDEALTGWLCFCDWPSA
jgi:hypothetical protein